MNPETLFKIALILHISAGAIALFVGPGAMVTIKGGKWHRFWGKIYVTAMGIVALTAFGMAYYHPNPFLGMVGVFSFYLAFSGWRILKRKRGAETLPPNALDFIAPAGAFLGGGWLLYLGSAALIARNTFGIVSLVFAVIGIFLAVTEVRGLLNPAAFRGKRIPGHIGRMGGGVYRHRHRVRCGQCPLSPSRPRLAPADGDWNPTDCPRYSRPQAPVERGYLECDSPPTAH